MTPEIARLLVQTDPRGIAARLLAHVIEVHEATAGAVLAVQRGRVILFASPERMALDDLKRATTLWDVRATDLAAGTPVRHGDAMILPVLLEATLVGGVWLGGVAGRPCDLGEVAEVLAAAITAPPIVPSGQEDALLMDLSAEDVLQRKTLLLLNQNEWNIARVARLMRCTRRTVYVRLERWGIDRKKIDKSPRRLDPSTAT